MRGLLLALIFTLFFSCAYAEKAEEFRLANGMKVVLLPIDDEAEDLHIALSALGGYTVLPEGDQASGQLAAEVVWESGLGTLNGDQLAVALYENSLEYTLEIDPFWRGMEGSATEESLPMFLKITNLFFTRPNFNEEIFKRTLKHAQEVAARRAADPGHAFEETALALNSQNHPGLRYLRIPDLQKVKFETIKSFFREAFSNPADFTLVISGTFNIEDVKPVVEAYMGNIPAKGPAKPWKVPTLNPFPKGVTVKTLPTQRESCLTQISFPLMTPIKPESVQSVETLCTIMEGRLRKAILKKYKALRCVAATYEYPYYPYLDHPWLTIQFQSDFDQVSTIQALIFKELQNLRKEGCTADELAAANALLSKAFASCKRNGEYWTAIYSNNLLWGWPIDSRDEIKAVQADRLPLAKEFRELFPIDQYTQISTQNGNQ